MIRHDMGEIELSEEADLEPVELRSGVADFIYQGMTRTVSFRPDGRSAKDYLPLIILRINELPVTVVYVESLDNGVPLIVIKQGNPACEFLRDWDAKHFPPKTAEIGKVAT